MTKLGKRWDKHERWREPTVLGEEDQHLIMIKSDIYFATILYIYGVSMPGKNWIVLIRLRIKLIECFSKNTDV